MIDLIKAQLKKIIKENVEIEVFPSEKENFGHYSTNVAFKLAKTRTDADKKSPMEIAKEIASNVMRQASGEFEKVEAVAPGFVNFWLKPEVLQNEVKQIANKKDLPAGRQGLKINVEFVSANPTGPLTMANGRGGFYGDVLANVLEWAGNEVTREYYVNDTGNQIRSLGLSILAARGIIGPKEGHYKGKYINELAKDKRLLKFKVADFAGKMATEILLEDIKRSLKSVGIKHNKFFSEDKELHKKGELKKVLEFLNKKVLAEEKDGALWLGDGVLIKSDGQPTYFLADMAYHYDKFINRKFNLAIDIWGADHHGYVARLKSGVKALGINPERLKIIITQMVRLIRGGEEVKMSKRTGEFVTMDELIKEVGVDAARFFFLMHSPDTHMDFDLDLAKERSQKNPVYYAQYAYVRAINILKKAKNQKPKAGSLDLLNSESETKLMLELINCPDILNQTAEDYQVHRLTKYVLELARSFHNFYERERVIGAGADLEKARLALVLATKIVLGNLFDILGISKPKKM